MVKHQYKLMFASIVMGLIWVGVYHLVAASWFFSRLSLLLAIISFVPAGLVVLAHGRELGPFMWWDRSNVALTTRRPRKVERLELTVMVVLLGRDLSSCHCCNLLAMIRDAQLAINRDNTHWGFRA
jgi:hypothetical protein